MRMKSAIVSILILMFCFVLSSCGTKKTVPAAGFAGSITSQDTAQVAWIRENIAAEYSEDGIAEDKPLRRETALYLYDLLDIKNLQSVTTGNAFMNARAEKEAIYLWFYTDKSKTIEGSCGWFSVYEDNIVCYGLSPELSSRNYYSAPAGTYEKVKTTIEKD